MYRLGKLTDMRKFVIALLILGFSIGIQTQEVHAVETSATIAKKLSKAGLGCTKFTKIETIFLGKRYSCISSAENISIEIFSNKNFKVANQMACSFGMRIITVTDNKTWTLIPESRANANKISKALKYPVKIICNDGPIINEVKNSDLDLAKNDKVSLTPSPSKSSTSQKGSFTNPYLIGDEFFLNGFKIKALNVINDSTSKVCESFQGKLIVPKLCNATYDSNYNVNVTVDDKALTKYMQWVLELTNSTDEIKNPENELVIEMTTSSGTLLYNALSYESNVLINWNNRIIPNGNISGNVFFEQPKSQNSTGLFLVLRSQDWNDNSTIYVKAE